MKTCIRSQKYRVMSSRIMCASDLNRVKEIKEPTKYLKKKKLLMKYKLQIG